MAKPEHPGDAVRRDIIDEICDGLGPDEIDALEYLADMSVPDFNITPESPWQIITRLVEDADRGGFQRTLAWFERWTRPSEPHPTLMCDAEARGAIYAKILGDVRELVGRASDRKSLKAPPDYKSDVAAWMQAGGQEAKSTGVRLKRDDVIAACVAHFGNRRGIKAEATRAYSRLDARIKQVRGRPTKA